jgi:hypothetical protein
MATPPTPTSPTAQAPEAAAAQALPPPVILAAMVRSARNVSDLIFSPDASRRWNRAGSWCR